MAHKKKPCAEKTIEISDTETSEDEYGLLGDNDQFYHLLDYQADDSDEAIDADLVTSYLPRGHIKIRRMQTVRTDGGEDVDVQLVETVNDSILSAAHITIVKAIERNIDWSPEHIVPELLGQEPFCYLDEKKVRTRVIKLWNDLSQKLKEEEKYAKKTGQGSPNNGTRRRKPSKHMVNWLERVEGLQMMIDGITPVVRPSPNERPKHRGKAQSGRSSNVNGHNSSSGPGSSMSGQNLDETNTTPSGPRRITGSPDPGLELNLRERELASTPTSPSGLGRITTQQSHGISTASVRPTNAPLARGGRPASTGPPLNEDSSAVGQRRLDFNIVGGSGPVDDQGSSERGRQNISSFQGRASNGKSGHMDDSVTKGKKASELARKIRQMATYGKRNKNKPVSSSEDDEKPRARKGKGKSKKGKRNSSDSSFEEDEKPRAGKRQRKSKYVREDSDVDELGFSMTDVMTAMQESREIARRDIELRERMFERNQDQQSSTDGGQPGQSPSSESGGQPGQSTSSGSGGSSPTLEQRVTAMERSLQEILRLLNGKGDKNDKKP